MQHFFMNYRVLNDLHLGVRRVAGTTPQSLQELRDYQFQVFESLLPDSDGLILLGDIFDGFEVDNLTVMRTFTTLYQWVTAGKHQRSLVLVAGNHDIGKRNDKISSFDLLANQLQCVVNGDSPLSKNPVTVVREGYTRIRETQFEKTIGVIPHMMNQDLFNLELEKVLSDDYARGFLLLHANCDNKFAEQSDHSLNVSSDMLRRLSDKFWVIFAHEHQARDFNDTVIIGNQIPSSIADCLGNTTKSYLEIDHLFATRKTCLNISDIFEEQDWRHLQESKAKFIRITGSASAGEASDAISTIAKFRQSSKAFVVSNAVAIEGVKGFENMSEITLDQMSQFNVLEALLSELEPKQIETVRKLLGEER